MNTELVREAERLKNGSDVHKTEELLRMYKTFAADAHESAQKAAKQFEAALERHVAKLRARRIQSMGLQVTVV